MILCFGWKCESQNNNYSCSAIKHTIFPSGMWKHKMVALNVKYYFKPYLQRAHGYTCLVIFLHWLQAIFFSRDKKKWTYIVGYILYIWMKPEQMRFFFSQQQTEINFSKHILHFTFQYISYNKYKHYTVFSLNTKIRRSALIHIVSSPLPPPNWDHCFSTCSVTGNNTTSIN